MENPEEDSQNKRSVIGPSLDDIADCQALINQYVTKSELEEVKKAREKTYKFTNLNTNFNIDDTVQLDETQMQMPLDNEYNHKDYTDEKENENERNWESETKKKGNFQSYNNHHNGYDRVWDDEEPIEEDNEQSIEEEERATKFFPREEIEKSEMENKNKVVSRYFQRDKRETSKNNTPKEDYLPPLQNKGESSRGNNENDEEIVNRYVDDKIKELNAQIQKFQKQNLELAQQKHQLDKDRNTVEKEKADLQIRIETENEKIEERWQKELRKIKKEKKIAEKHRKAMANKPNRNEREEIEALKAQVFQLESKIQEKESKMKLTIERLKNQVSELEQKNGRLQEQVLFYEQMRLRNEDQSKPTSKRRRSKSKNKKSSKKHNSNSNSDDGKSKHRHRSKEKENKQQKQRKESLESESDSDSSGSQNGDGDVYINIGEYNFDSNTFYKNYQNERGKKLQVIDQFIAPNGEIQRTFQNGKKEIVFVNGARKEVSTIPVNLFSFLRTSTLQSTL